MITTTDPIADLLTRIRNAYMAKKITLTLPHSKEKSAILQILKDRHFIHAFKEVKNNQFAELEIELNSNIHSLVLKRISKPGQRIYTKSSLLKKVNGGLGVAILSTPKGIMSGEDAKKQNVGGELICEIY